MHSTPHHVTLYLLPLRNIIWATRSELAKRGVLELTEATFLRKLLLMSMDRVHQVSEAYFGSGSFYHLQTYTVSIFLCAGTGISNFMGSSRCL
jgi:hypothetical protein